MRPGATAFTRIPWGPYSAAIWRVSPTIPALAAVYAACLAMPTIAKPEAMLRMLPRRLRNSGKASRHRRNVAERLALIQYSKSSSEVSWADFELPTPAMLASTSRPPNLATQASMRSADAPFAATSQKCGCQRSAAGGSFARVSGLRSTAKTDAPSLKKRSATARPMPEAAPVTMATLPLKRSFMRDPQGERCDSRKASDDMRPFNKDVIDENRNKAARHPAVDAL